MIETKEIILHRDRELYAMCQSYIKDLTAFGWQPTQETSRRSGRITHYYQIMARETSNPHYNEYRRLEINYEAARGKLKYYDSMEFSTVILLLLLLIIPGVLYITFKLIQKNNIKNHNIMCRQKMRAAIDAARALK